MRRLCFDIETNLWWGKESDNPNIEDRERYLARTDKVKPIKFNCAAVYDELNGEMLTFGESQCDEFVSLLKEGDLLISYFGKKSDLLILKFLYKDNFEFPSETNRIEELMCCWPHVDLTEVHPSRLSLEERTEKILPTKYTEYKRKFDANYSDDDGKINQAIFDVECTYALFEDIMCSRR